MNTMNTGSHNSKEAMQQLDDELMDKQSYNSGSLGKESVMENKYMNLLSQ